MWRWRRSGTEVGAVRLVLYSRYGGATIVICMSRVTRPYLHWRSWLLKHGSLAWFCPWFVLP